MTLAVATVLRTFLDEPSKSRYGYDLMRATGFPSGKLYPILARLATAEWLLRERESADPAHEGRPVRYLYRINPACAAEVRQRLAEVSRQVQPRTAAVPRGRLAPGQGQI